MTAKRATTVDQYINSAAGKAQPHLRSLRELLQRVAPKAQETIKWGNPFFIEPRFLFAYSAHKNHVSFTPSAESLEAFRDQLATYDTTKHFLKIRYEEPLPEALIRKIARHRLKVVNDRDDDGFW
ncbi:MAG: DUF1801 domain-containing protein [Dokdonella sp.]